MENYSNFRNKMHKIVLFPIQYFLIVKDFLLCGWSIREIRFYLTGKSKEGMSPEIFYSFSIGLFVLLYSFLDPITSFSISHPKILKLDAIRSEEFIIRLLYTTIGSVSMAFPVKWLFSLVDFILRFIFLKFFKSNLPFSSKHIQYSLGASLTIFILLDLYVRFFCIFMNYLHPESSTSNSFFALLNFLFTVLMMLITLFVSIFLGGRILIGPGVNYFGSFMSRFFLGKYRQTSTSVNFDLNSPALFETPTEKDIKRVQEMWDDEMKDEALRPNFKLYLISAPFAVVSAIHIWIALGVAQSVDKKYVIFKQTYRFIKGFFN